MGASVVCIFCIGLLSSSLHCSVIIAVIFLILFHWLHCTQLSVTVGYVGLVPGTSPLPLSLERVDLPWLHLSMRKLQLVVGLLSCVQLGHAAGN